MLQNLLITVFISVVLVKCFSAEAFAPTFRLPTHILLTSRWIQSTYLALTFYSDFDDINNNSSDDEEDMIGEEAMAELRSRISADFTSRTPSSNDERTDDWPVEELLLPQSDPTTTSFSSIDALISFVSSQSSSVAPITDWAKPLDIPTDMSKLRPGVVLIANPAKFCADFGGPDKSFFMQKRPSSALLAKVCYTTRPYESFSH